MSAVAEPDSTHVDAPDGLLGDLGIGTDDFGEEAADGASEKEGGARGFANAMSQILSKTIPKTKSKVRHSVVSELHVYVCVCVCVCVCVAGKGVLHCCGPCSELYVYESGSVRLGAAPTGGVELYCIRRGLVAMVLRWALRGLYDDARAVGRGGLLWWQEAISVLEGPRQRSDR